MTVTGDFVSGTTTPFQRFREMNLAQGGGIQAGVVSAGDLMVTQRGAGVNQSVDIAAGEAWVRILTGTRNGIAHCTSDAVANIALTAANATNPRIDQIILRYNSTAVPTGSGDIPTLEVATGTATAGATLANRTGVATISGDFLLLADILVPATSTTVSNTQIRDRRPWARGAYIRIARTAGSYSTASTSLVEIDATNLKPRIECSGVPLKLSLHGNMSNSLAANMVIGFNIDGAGIDSTTNLEVQPASAAAGFAVVSCVYVTVPAAGSHQFSPTYATGSGTMTLAATTVSPLIFTVEEIVRPNTANNTVTTG